MFDDMKEKMRRAKEAKEHARHERDRMEREYQSEAAKAQAAEEERERRIRSIRVISGDVKYRYVVLDTLRTVGYAEFSGNRLIDPDEATRNAMQQMQDLAFSLGADAVVHAQFQVLRYTIQQRQMYYVPVYETHIFGTAIKVMGPPTDWNNVNEGTVG